MQPPQIVRKFEVPQERSQNTISNQCGFAPIIMAQHREVLDQPMIFEKPVVPLPYFNEDDFYGGGSYPSLLSPSRHFFGKKKQQADIHHFPHMMMNPESTDHYYVKTNFYDPFKEESQMQE